MLDRKDLSKQAEELRRYIRSTTGMDHHVGWMCSAEGEANFIVYVYGELTKLHDRIPQTWCGNPVTIQQMRLDPRSQFLGQLGQ